MLYCSAMQHQGEGRRDHREPMAYYPVYDVTRSTTDRPETLGTKEKFWLVPSAAVGLDLTSYLFKIGRPHTGENWSEKVCCEILH